MERMVKLVVCCALALAGCTRINPEACCVTDAQCTALGVTDHLPCPAGQACSPETASCVAPQCTTSADCASADASVCSHQLCIAACQLDDDCSATPGAPRCEVSTGQCVGCLDASGCTADHPFCDAGSHACRGCAVDDECPSGVCIEADAVCATADQLLHVSSIGTDVGDCVAAPCGSISYALQHTTATRTIIRVAGSSLPAQTSTVTIDHAVVIDGDGTTTFTTRTSNPSFAVTAVSGVVTLEGVAIVSTPTGTSDFRIPLVVAAGSALRMFAVPVSQSLVHIDGSLDAQQVTMTSSSLDCTAGTLTVRESAFATTAIHAMNCATTIARSRFDPASDQGVNGIGGPLIIENNIFVSPSEFTNALTAASNSPGSVIAYNTFVNTSTVTQSPAAISCDATDRVTSNVIAYNSTNPIDVDGCVAHASLFDLVGAPDASGNTTGDVKTFFQNREAGDYHLAAGSPAIGIGEPGLVTVDFDGHSRPLPTGSLPDVGAYEAR